MKKSVLVLALAGVLAGLSASAVPLKVKFQDGPGSVGGGEFIATIWDIGPNPDVAITTWTTFCLEKSISIGLDWPYDFTIDDELVKTGGGGPNPDPISIATGLLYSEFIAGVLPYAYGNPVQRELDANDLQVAFWWLEDEITLTAAQQAANPYIAYAGTKIVGNLKADNAGLYPVDVMNVYDWSSTQNPDRQSVLIPVPDGGAAGLLLALGISGLAFLRRKS